MGVTRLSSIKGSTKDITLALYMNANPELAEVLPPADIQNAALADMLLARAGSVMLKAPELLQSLDSNIKSVVAGNAKIPAVLVKQSEDVQSKFNNYENIRKSLERQLMDYANNRKNEAREIIQSVLEGKTTRDVAVQKLNDLNEKTKHLRSKIEAVTKDYHAVKDAQTKTLEDIYKSVPGKNLAELQKLLQQDATAPRPE